MDENRPSEIPQFKRNQFYVTSIFSYLSYNDVGTLSFSITLVYIFLEMVFRSLSSKEKRTVTVRLF